MRRRCRLSASTAHLAHHFESLEQQHNANVLGMWLFLTTEVMVFGGLFGAYAVYRNVYPLEWAAGSHELSPWFGGGNTLVLLTSSFTMALAVHAAQVGRRGQLVGFLLLTALLGTAFLVIKGFEYHQDYEEKLVPGENFKTGWGVPRERRAHRPDLGPEPPGAQSQAPGEPIAASTGPETAGQEFGRRVQLFFLMYYLMTGLHALHMIIGLGILLTLAVLAWRGNYGPDYYSPVEVGGLYWHFVDVIWIFLLP